MHYVYLAIAILLWLSTSVQAASSTIVPTADSATGSWTSTPLFSKISEDIDSPDATVIQSPNNPTSTTNDITFTIACPSDLDTITAATLRVRAKATATSGKIPSFTASWSATASTNVTSGSLTTTMTNFTSGSQVVSITAATCGSSTLKIAPATSGSGAATAIQVDSFNLDITYTPITGGNRRVIRFQ